MLYYTTRRSGGHAMQLYMLYVIDNNFIINIRDLYVMDNNSTINMIQDT